MSTPAPRHRLVAIATAVAVSTGCAMTSPVAVAPRPIDPDLRVGRLAERTHFEQTPSPTRTRAAAASDDGGRERAEKRRKALFWTGIGLGGFGAAGLAGFGIGGRIVQKQIDDGYEDGSLSHADENRLTTTGEIMNGLAIGSAVAGLVGLSMAAIVYGIDNARCGQLAAPRRKGCRPGADEVEPEPER